MTEAICGTCKHAETDHEVKTIQHRSCNAEDCSCGNGPEVYGLKLRPLKNNCQATKVIAIVEYVDMESGDSFLAAKYSDDLRLWEIVGMLETIKAEEIAKFTDLPDEPDLDL